MSTATFNNKFYIVGFFFLALMSFTVIYTFRTLFESLTRAFEVETKIPESELRINRKNLDKAYSSVFESEPTKLDLEYFTINNLETSNEEDEEGDVDVESPQEEGN